MISLELKKSALAKSEVKTRNKAPVDALRDSIKLCRICTTKKSRYTCPKCLIQYCSVTCYRSHNEICTEDFSRDKVKEYVRMEKEFNADSAIQTHQQAKLIQKQEQNESEKEENTNLKSIGMVNEQLSIIERLEECEYDMKCLSPAERAYVRRMIDGGLLDNFIEIRRPWWVKPNQDQVKLQLQLQRQFDEHERDHYQDDDKNEDEDDEHDDSLPPLEPIEFTECTNENTIKTKKTDTIDLLRQIRHNHEQFVHEITRLKVLFPTLNRTQSIRSSGPLGVRPTSALMLQLLDMVLCYVMTMRTLNCNWLETETESEIGVESISKIGGAMAALDLMERHCKALSPTYRPQSVADGLSSWRSRMIVSELYLSPAGILALIDDALVILNSSAMTIYMLIDSWLLGLVNAGQADITDVYSLASGNLPNSVLLWKLIQKYLPIFNSRVNADELGKTKTKTKMMTDFRSRLGERLARKSFFILGAMLGTEMGALDDSRSQNDSSRNDGYLQDLVKEIQRLVTVDVNALPTESN